MLAVDSTGDERSVAGTTRPMRLPENNSRAIPSKNGHAGRWLSINAACEILGVDKSTLRRWSDNGRVPVFRTPGGHRRYSEADLHAFLAGELVQQRRVSRRELAALARDEFERRKARGGLDLYNGFMQPDDWTNELAQTRDRMIDLCIRYASGRGDPDEMLASARELAQGYGRCTASANLEMSQVVESFLRFRRPLLDALARYGEKEKLTVKRCVRMMGKLNGYLDVMLTSLVEAHEAHSAA